MILFFIHRFNDIDHLTPIIYKLAKETDKEIKILAINPFVDIENDFRLKFLERKFGLSSNYLIDSFKPSLIYEVLAYFMARPYVKNDINFNLRKALKDLTDFNFKSFLYSVSRLISGTLRRLISRFDLYQKLLRNFYNESYANKLLSQYKPSLIIFDHASTSTQKNGIGTTPPIKWIAGEAKKKSIPILSLPHGVPLFFNSPKVYDKRKKWIAKDLSDHIVLQHEWWHEEVINFGLERERSSVQGLPRFCDEWIRILHAIVPGYDSFEYEGSEKLRIVYMDTGPDNYSNKKNHAQELIDYLSDLDYIHLIYKPHTRSNKSHLRASHSVEIGTDINSVKLIEWSDAVIGMHSSIMIEALIQKKIYISPKYFRDFDLLYEKYKACFIAHSLNDIVGALEKMKKNKNVALYAQDDVDKFMTDVVMNRESHADVLGNYLALIEKMMNKDNIKC